MTVSHRGLALAHFVCAFLVFGAFFASVPVLWDNDSYYHVAVARLYVEEGVAAKIPWARFSLLSGGADKEFLFHVLLMPFAAMEDAAMGGRLALAFFNAAITTAIGVVAARFTGSVGFLFPLWVWIAAPPFFARAIRLRPELLALLLLVLAIAAASRRRYLALWMIGFAFALGYTAHHAFVGIMVMWALADWWRSRKPDFRLLLAPVGGAVAGLLCRPWPIENARIWFVQNVLFFANKARLDVGEEILPPAMPRTLLVSLPWLLAIGVMAWLAWRDAREHDDREPAIASAATYATIAAIVFTLLFLRMGRMATYAYPLVTLVAAAYAARRVRPVRIAAILAISAVAAVPLTFDRNVRDVIRTADLAVSELDWAQFGAAVPPGANVAARWSDAEAYAFWAPQGRYLNVLDPIFMALPFPAQYEAQRRMFRGGDPDVPLTVKRTLDSDYLALDFTQVPEILQARLRSDPRFEVVYGGYNLLLRVRPPRPGYFVTRWSPLPPSEDVMAGFVDATALAGNGCVTLTHVKQVAAGERVAFGFSPWGASELSVDGRIVATVAQPQLGVLGRGARVDLDLSPGGHTVAVRTCRSGDYAGFYLVDLGAQKVTGNVVGSARPQPR